MFKKLDNSSLNFIVAVCAMLVSVASFYATYLQAESAKQQVKAMTYPLIQYSHGNFSDGERQLSFYVINNGVGPAIVKNVDFVYKEKTYPDLGGFIKACCEEEYLAFEVSEKQGKLNKGEGLMTLPVENVIIPAQGHNEFLIFKKRPVSTPLWDKLNRARFDSLLSVCYCSLLNDCFTTDGRGTVNKVEVCPI